MFSEISQKIDNMISHIENRENMIKQIAEDIKNNTPSIKKAIKPIELNNITIAGIDGGLLKKEYSTLSVIITRAVGVIFNYKDGKLKETSYIPSAVAHPKYFMTEIPKDPHELDREASIIRITEEIARAIECADRNPNMIILDGAIIPHPSTEPKAKTGLSEKYKNLIKRIEHLINICKKNKIILAGVCEDSRSDSYCKTLGIREDCADIRLASYLLEKDERTEVYQTEVPKDFNSIKQSIYNIIIKPSEYDKPMRIQFISTTDTQKTADTLSSIINRISSHHREYAAPTVLIEADQRAKLDSSELLFIENEIKTRLGTRTASFELRRNRRPF